MNSQTAADERNLAAKNGQEAHEQPQGKPPAAKSGQEANQGGRPQQSKAAGSGEQTRDGSRRLTALHGK